MYVKIVTVLPGCAPQCLRDFVAGLVQSFLRETYVGVIPRGVSVLDEEIRRLLSAAKARVRCTLERERAATDALAQLLQERKVVDRTTLDAVPGKPPAATAARLQRRVPRSLAP